MLGRSPPSSPRRRARAPPCVASQRTCLLTRRGGRQWRPWQRAPPRPRPLPRPPRRVLRPVAVIPLSAALCAAGGGIPRCGGDTLCEPKIVLQCGASQFLSAFVPKLTCLRLFSFAVVAGGSFVHARYKHSARRQCLGLFDGWPTVRSFAASAYCQGICSFEFEPWCAGGGPLQACRSAGERAVSARLARHRPATIQSNCSSFLPGPAAWPACC